MNSVQINILRHGLHILWLCVLSDKKIQQGFFGVLVRFRGQRPCKFWPFGQRLLAIHMHESATSIFNRSPETPRPRSPLPSASTSRMQRAEYSSESSDTDNFPTTDKLLDRKMRKAAAQRWYYQKYANHPYTMPSYLYLHVQE